MDDNSRGTAKHKRPAAWLTALRVFLAVGMVFIGRYDLACAVIYLLCGLTDVLDGAVARWTGTDDEKGAQMDTVADCVFVAAALMVYLPRYELTAELWMAAGVIAAVKAMTLLVSVLKFKRPLMLHTYLNKLAGLMLFIAPIALEWLPLGGTANIIGITAGAAALEELIITVVSHYPRPNRTALLQKRHIKYVLYGKSFGNAIKKKKRYPYNGGQLRGVNFVGNLSGDNAQGQSGRLVLEALRTAGVDICAHDYPSYHGMLLLRIPRILKERKAKMPYNVTLLRLDPLDIPEGCARRGSRIFRDSYIIGYWRWEQELLTFEQKRCLELVDEIWTPSEFVSRAVSRATDKPVTTIPYAVSAHPQPQYDRAHFGLPEDMVLYMLTFDSGSDGSERKNPLGAVRAFANAFPDGSERVGLIIKATEATKFELNQIRSALGLGKSLFIFSKSMSKEECDSLLNCADVFISLHRGESFGLTMAEAMLLGKPVIASEWSANMEYMDDKSACLVRCELKALEHECPPYHKGSVWAEPDEKHAAELIRKLYDSPELRENIGSCAAARAAECFDSSLPGKLMRRRLDAIDAISGSAER